MSSSGTLPRWGAMLRGACWELGTSAEPIGGRGSGYSPLIDGARHYSSGLGLTGYLPTPVANDLMMIMASVKWMFRDGTLRRVGHRPSGVKVGCMLSWYLVMWHRKNGGSLDLEARRSLHPDPLLYELLMGWQKGWSSDESRRSGTASSRKWLRLHSEFSAPPSRPETQQVDTLSKSERSALMKKIKSKWTRPELRTKAALDAIGAEYSPHDSTLPGTPDFALHGPKTAVMVNGCFWHDHECRKGKKPKTSPEYWVPKLLKNRERGEKAMARLEAVGWKAVVLWECEAKKMSDEELAAWLRSRIGRLPR